MTYKYNALTGQFDLVGDSVTLNLTPVLQFRPFDAALVNIENVGSTAVFQSNLLYNTDGSGSGINVSVPNVPGVDYVKIWYPFFGTTFGVRWSSGNSTPFSVQVDGGSIQRVQNPNQYMISEGRAPTASNYELQQITHTGLDKTWHTAQIMFAPGEAAILLGYIIDASFNFGAPLYRNATLSSQKVIGVGPANITNMQPNSSTIGSSSIPFTWIGKILYSNYAATDGTVYHTTGSNLTVNGVTIAGGSTAAVISTTTAHGFSDGQAVGTFNIGGATGVNLTVAYAKATGNPSTSFGLYSDPGLTTAIVGGGSYTSGGTVVVITNQFLIPKGDTKEITMPQPLSSIVVNHFAAAAGIQFVAYGGYTV